MLNWFRSRGQAHSDLEPEFLEIYADCAAYTMTSIERMHGLWASVRHIVRHAIPGDLVECGVWRGGSSMLIARTLLSLGEPQRRLWLYDTFAGMTEPSERDVEYTGRRIVQGWDRIRGDRESPYFALSGLPEVRANMSSTGYPDSLIAYAVGPVEETIPTTAPEQIALLRLDTDWYESTRHELEHLWPRVHIGGVMIVDDYGHWVGAREAVDEYFTGRGDAPLLVRLDYSGRIAVKTASNQPPPVVS